MTAGSLAIDEQMSWARRVGDTVSVQLRVPGAALEPGVARVGLANEVTQFHVTAQVRAGEGATLVTFSAPQSELGHTAWSLAIQSSASTHFVGLRARLLASAKLPVALLPGAEPVPRTRPTSPRTHRTPVRWFAGVLPAPVRRVLRRARAVGRKALARARR